MIEKLIGKLSSQRRTRISLEVRETNLAAQIVLPPSGFKATSVLHEFYDDSPEDAYLMQFRHRMQPAAVIIPINRITKLAG